MATEYVKTIECPKCRYKNVAGTKFCGDCGTALAVGVPLNCGKCGTENPPGQKFCGSCGNTLVANAETDPDIRNLQEALKERYVILKSLGEGGFGRVFLAEHTGLKQKHVIKVLSADSSRSADIRNRFFQEAQVIARLKHPNIVPIMDVAEYGGRPYYIMSYIEGGSLADLLLKEKKLSTTRAITIVGKLLSALSEVHGKGIIHRDIKPDNVLLELSGEPILIDFGIARIEEGSRAKTGTGFSIGTPVYMSPEQLDAKPISLTTDIYSLGIMFFELLTGKPPYEGSMSSLITQHNNAKLPTVSGKIEESQLADAIQDVIQQACAKEPSARYSSAKEMRGAVEGLLQFREEKPEPIKRHDTYKKEKSEIISPEEIRPVRRIIQEEIPQKETYQNKPLLSESYVQKNYKIYGLVMALVVALLGGYFFINKNQTNTNFIGKESKLQQVGEGEGALNIIAWPGYIERGASDKSYDWVTKFEESTGCKVSVKEAATSDEMVSLMNLEDGDFDLVTASGDASFRLIMGGKVQEVNIDLISSWKNVDERLQNAAWYTVDGKHYGVPYQWCPNVLMYNTKVFKDAPTSWEVVFEEMNLPDGKPNKGRVQAFDGPIYIADAALYLKMKNPELKIQDPYALDETQYAEVIALLRKQRTLVPKYWHDAAVHVDDFKVKSFVASSSWPFQVNLLKGENQPVDSVIPKEGATGWADTTMLHKNSKHVNCAYKWMEHSISIDVQGSVASWFGSVPVTPKACKGHPLLGDEGCKTNGFENFSKISFWRTPIADCGDGRKCVPYKKWSEDFISIISSK